MQKQALKTIKTQVKSSGRFHMACPAELREAIVLVMELEQSPDTIGEFFKTAALEKIQAAYEKRKLTPPSIIFRKRGQPKKKVEIST